MFQRLGAFTYRRRRLVGLVWLGILAIGLVLGGTTISRLATDMDGGSSALESVQVAHALTQIDSRGGEVVAIVDGVDVSRPQAAMALTDVTDEVVKMEGVHVVHDPVRTPLPALTADDGTAALVLVELEHGLDHATEEAVAHTVADRLREINAPNVIVGGDVLVGAEFQEASERDLQRGEMIALPIAFVAMVVIFGGLRAAGMPIIVALTAVSGALVVLLVATGLMTVSIFAINVVMMLGIGLGIDYGLLMVSRFREERAAGAEMADAVERTVATAGMTVSFSALIVAVALSGLFVFDNPAFRAFGVAGAGVVLVAMASALTLLPALLGMWGRRIRPSAPRSEHGGFARLARLVQRRAVPVVVVVTLGLAALALPFLGARFEAGDARSLPRSSETREVALTLAERFPGRGTEPVVVLAHAGSGDPRVTRFVEEVGGMESVATVSIRPTPDLQVSVVEVVPEGTSQDDDAQRLVRDLRAADTGLEIQVGGVAAQLVDVKGSIADRLPFALGLIAVATFVLLFLMTGSIAVPIKAIVMNLLSLGASFGGLVWVFQEGHLAWLLGFEPVGSVDLFMPVLIFIFAFGLSMDYEVFLLARVKEVYEQTGDNDAAVAVALQRTGKIITSAALLIVVVFAGFAAGEVLMIKQLGFGLALAVIVDATVVRSLLVPATMKLLGERNWWAPEPLRRLHDRLGIREPAAAPEPIVVTEPSRDPSPELAAV